MDCQSLGDLRYFILGIIPFVGMQVMASRLERNSLHQLMMRVWHGEVGYKFRQSGPPILSILFPGAVAYGIYEGSSGFCIGYSILGIVLFIVVQVMESRTGRPHGSSLLNIRRILKPNLISRGLYVLATFVKLASQGRAGSTLLANLILVVVTTLLFQEWYGNQVLLTKSQYAYKSVEYKERHIREV